jgi:F420-non-reducing hydrogenase iron-sulfur subunit
MSIGIDPARLEMFNLSAAMGPRWAEICTEFTEKVRNFGPSPVSLEIKLSSSVAQKRSDTQ